MEASRHLKSSTNSFLRCDPRHPHRLFPLCYCDEECLVFTLLPLPLEYKPAPAIWGMHTFYLLWNVYFILLSFFIHDKQCFDIMFSVSLFPRPSAPVPPQASRHRPRRPSCPTPPLPLPFLRPSRSPAISRRVPPPIRGPGANRSCVWSLSVPPPPGPRAGFFLRWYVF